ncbi:MAG: nicotinamide mononucleotide deamidase-related protein [Candidatus Bathyarchaeota archaeon]|nr:nicotinamide mononucleotide deamidase-related protein [Candidatus Bathyarchaeota archaeon]
MTVDMEIICVGNELLIGKVVNTNASWLGKRATALGVAVKRITVVADVIEEMSTAFQEALSRKPKFIVVTGGLGPTFDDKTLEGIAKALNRNLSVSKEALDMVKAKYGEYTKTRNIPEDELTPARVKMATLPADTTPIRNPVGTAPAIRADLNDTVLVVLPGVPREMEAIFEESVAPLLRQAAGDRGFFELSIYAEKIMESVIAPLIDTVMHENPLVYIKSHPKGRENQPHIELHLSTSGKPSDNPQNRLAKAALQLSALIEKTDGEVVKVESQGQV